MLLQAALDREIKVQELLERAVEAYLSKADAHRESDFHGTTCNSENIAYNPSLIRDRFLKTDSRDRWELAHAQLDAIRHLNDAEVSAAIWSNLAVFSRFSRPEAASDERGGGILPAPAGSSFAEKLSAADESAAAAIEQSREITVESRSVIEGIEEERRIAQQNKRGNRGRAKKAGGGSGD